jgi:hypothetical protein
VPLAALLPDPSPAPLASGSKTGQIGTTKTGQIISQPHTAGGLIAGQGLWR